MTDEPHGDAPKPRRDLLLTSARVVLTIIVALVCVIGVGLLAAAAALPLWQTEVFAKVFEETGKHPGGDFIVALEGLFVLLFVGGILAYRWLRQLGRIIDSVAHGEAFAPLNAARLENMGWLTFGIEAISIPAGAIAGYLTHHFGREHIEIGPSLTGVLMGLVLFILARVFREGAAMREELEGTV
jgi:hypothetical protein